LISPHVPALNVKRYLELNHSSGNPFIYTLTRRGFFSEVSCLLNAVAFGLIARRRLFVVKERSNGIGWNDYFDADLPKQTRRDRVPVDPEWVPALAWHARRRVLRVLLPPRPQGTRCRDHGSWPTFEHFAEQVVVEHQRTNYRAQAHGRNVEHAVRLLRIDGLRAPGTTGTYPSFGRPDLVFRGGDQRY
jgi:hypothetical protein